MGTLRFCRCLTAILITVIFLCTAVYAEKIAVLKGLTSKPHYLKIDTERFYVGMNTSIYIYSLTDFRLIKKFGKSGDGVGEFDRFAVAHPRTDDLMVATFGKVFVYTKDGAYKSELTDESTTWGSRKPLGKQVAAVQFGYLGDTLHRTICVFDAGMTRKVTVFHEEYPAPMGDNVNPVALLQPSDFFTCGDRLVIPGRNGDILICDAAGERRVTFRPTLKKIKITPADRARYTAFFKKSPHLRAYVETDTRRPAFPDHFPHSRYHMVADQQVYVVTFERKNNKSLCLVYDFQGKLLQRTWLPYFYPNGIERYISAVKGRRFYRVIRDPADGKYYLHVTPLK